MITAAASDAGRAAFKRAVKAGQPTFGLFLDSASPLVAEQCAGFGYDYVLVSCLVCKLWYAAKEEHRSRNRTRFAEVSLRVCCA